MVEKPAVEDAPSRLFAVARYLLSPRVMGLLADQQPGAGNDVQLTDATVRLWLRRSSTLWSLTSTRAMTLEPPAGWIATNARLAANDLKFASAFQEAMEA